MNSIERLRACLARHLNSAALRFGVIAIAAFVVLATLVAGFLGAGHGPAADQVLVAPLRWVSG